MDVISVETFELENECQEKWEKETKRLEQLSEIVHNLHVKCLYCRERDVGRVAKEAWMIVVKKVGAACGHWRELGIFLGLSGDDLDYIEYSVNADKTDTVLRVYMQKENATLDNVTNALVKMKRYDVLEAIEKPLLQMNKSLIGMHNSDAGYSSYSENIITPSNIQNNLPEVLQIANVYSDTSEKYSSDYKFKPVQLIDDLNESRVIIFLTFVEDGRQTAEKVETLIKGWQDDAVDIEIVTLNSRRDEVKKNAEMNIQNYIDKADYVVPIVTEGYMAAVSSHNRRDVTNEDNLDCQYVRYIFMQLNQKFSLIDSCFNKNVRCVIPSYEDSNITMKLRNHQILVPWTWEADFDSTFKDLINISVSNKTK